MLFNCSTTDLFRKSNHNLSLPHMTLYGYIYLYKLPAKVTLLVKPSASYPFTCAMLITLLNLAYVM